MDEDKSVLDGITVDNQAFPLRRAPQGGLSSAPAENHLTVTGCCPHCGAPIYGRPFIPFDTTPVVTYACTCWRRQGTVRQQLETKEP